MWFKKKMQSLYDRLEAPLFTWPGTKEIFKISHSLAGILVMGASRTGKTSSVLKFIIRAWFRAGFGGLLAVTRVNDASMYIEIAKECGRENDILYFHECSPLQLNILEFELSRFKSGEVDLESVVDNLLLIHEMISNYESGGGGGNDEDKFWKNSAKNLLTYSLSLLILAERTVSWKALRKVAQDALNEEGLNKYFELWAVLETQDDNSEAWQNTWEEYSEWRANNVFIDVYDTANVRGNLSDDERESMQDVSDYFLYQFSKLAPKTKSIVLEIIQGICRPFETSKILKNHFSNGFSPELHPKQTYLKNKIVICGFGVKEHGLSGLIATGIMKLIYTQEWERRDIEKEGINALPVALVLDEFQFYMNSAAKDSLYVSTAGGSLICNIFVTQNIDNIIMSMGGQNAGSKARSLCGNLSTKLFCANANFTTNKWVSDMIGSHFIDTKSTSINFETGSKQSFSQHYHPKVPIDHFTMLKTGRKENHFCVETVVFQNGKTWLTGQNFEEITFRQDH